MTDVRQLGPWVRRFLEEHLTSERNLARNTQLSYRDTFTLLLPFASDWARKPVDRLAVRDLDPDCVRAFLGHLEQETGLLPADSEPAPRGRAVLRPLRRQPQSRTC